MLVVAAGHLIRMVVIIKPLVVMVVMVVEAVAALVVHLMLLVQVGLVEIMDQVDLHQEVRVLLVVALLVTTLVEVVVEPQGGLPLETGLVVAVDLESSWLHIPQHN